MKIIRYVSLFIFTSIFAQVRQPNNPSLQELAYFLDVNNAKYENAEGSKYIFDEFKLAKIAGYPGSYLIRLDVVDDIIELKKEASQIKTLSNKKAYQIEFLDSSGTFETWSYLAKDKKMAHSFFEERHTTPQFVLFKKHRTKFEPVKPAKSSYEPETPAKFIKKESTYYFLNRQDNSKSLIEIPRKKKALLALLSEKTKEIGAIMKKERLKTNVEKDLITILEYYFQ